MMTKEQQRIAIAEWMGYVWYCAPKDKHFPDKKYRFLALPQIQECEGQLDIWKQRADGTERIIESEPWKKAQGVDYVPNYPLDLNAMHEAEMKLTTRQCREYFTALKSIIVGDKNAEPNRAYLESMLTSSELSILCPSQQRSEALCRVIVPERFQ